MAVRATAFEHYLDVDRIFSECVFFLYVDLRIGQDPIDLTAAVVLSVLSNFAFGGRHRMPGHVFAPSVVAPKTTSA